MGAISCSELAVLLVDDDSFMQDAAASLLRGFGVATIACAVEAGQAVALYERARSKPQLILVALHLLDSNGIVFMQTLVQRRYAGALALLSAREDSALHAASLAAQFPQLHLRGALGRPVSRAALGTLLATLPAFGPAATVIASAR